MAITTCGGKYTIDPPMPSDVEIVVEKDVDEMKVTGEMKDVVEKEDDLTQKVIPMPRPPPPFPQRSLVQIKEDPGAFTIPCTIYKLHFAKALCDLSANIDLMPLSIYKKLGLGAPKPIVMRLLMADKTVKKPIGVLQDVLVKVGSFIFPADFVILDCEVDFEVPIILGRPFLATGRALVDIEKGQMKFQLNKEEVSFNICRSMKQESDLKSVSLVSHIVGQYYVMSSKENLGAALRKEKKHHD
ncbi:uncharacterized protein LOC125841797 [Solanum stenotomum]|uniref:uncharacterized protein LOC125841797 n=1 Tax=Solanum stenotomum TaxID=172797 RepID=UPI0020D156BE|nr:uncharacterized protein LOC125841797 [Solanum stenotomum]